MRFFSILAAFALVAQPGTASAMAEPRAPTGKWNVDFGKSQCVAILPFADGDDEEFLAIKPIPTGTHVTFAMVVDGKKRSAKVSDYALHINGIEQPSQLLHYGTDTKKKIYRYLVNIPVRELAAIERLTLEVPGKDFDLAVPQMGDIANVLKACMDDLRVYWNIVDGEVATGPRGNLNGLIGPDDYPADAWKEQESGIVRVFLLVDEEGDVADCTVSAYVGNFSLANQTCALLSSRAKFNPALDSEGNATRGHFVQSFRWQMAGSRRTLDQLAAEMRKLQDANADCIEY